jgi:hypothetical protein
MDPIGPRIPKIAYGNQYLNRIYYDETLIWPIPPGTRLPGTFAFAEGYNILPDLNAFLTTASRAGNTPIDTGARAVGTNQLFGKVGPIQEGTVVVMATMQAGNLAWGSNFPVFVSHNGNWWTMCNYRRSLQMQSPPWPSSIPGRNMFRGFYISRAYNGGMTQAQMVAAIPANTFALLVDVDTHTMTVIGNAAVQRAVTISGAGAVTQTNYFLPPGMTDNDLIWPPAPGAEPLGPRV